MSDLLRKAIEGSNLKWLKDRTIFVTRHGSHAYGTNIASSDEDFKGVAIPPPEYFFGYLEQFGQAVLKHQVDGIDAAIYDVRKFFKLAADCNPSIIEVLFTAPEDHVHLTHTGAYLLQHRDKFISKKAKHTFSGYAVAQLKKIKSHKKWISSPPKAPPTREEFGLPECTRIPADQLAAAQSMIRKQVAQWNVPIDELDDAARIAVQERFVEALALIETGAKARLLAELEAAYARAGDSYEDDGRAGACMSGFRDAMNIVKTQPGADLERIAGQLQGFDDNFLDHLDREKRYKTKMEEWRSYQTWLATRNPARSELEAKFGYDTKHGMHLVRLVRMGEEILRGQGVQVKRPDAEELLSIRFGAWTYDRLLEWAEAKLKTLDELYITSTIPSAPDRKQLDVICQTMVRWELA